MSVHSLLRVEAASLLEGLGKDGNSRIDGVGNDTDKCVRAVLGDPVGEVGADTSIDAEKVISAHQDSTRKVVRDRLAAFMLQYHLKRTWSFRASWELRRE